ncbi:tail fiber domain-containing protein [Staphylococcus chromogenes]|uniref:tail fiber domain-containing protein n=1 Tax=Staphylococcus chromogenes TaxID=46126 RepID=UPI002885008B|nr:tail fiber domain-containing protein [Staphylococcus chromogenes]MDT0700447.1 tail fiber domain-containing protein [Staphylococcus chromogenes]
MPKFDNTYVLKLDVKQQNPNPQIKFVQYDSAYLYIELYDGGRKIELKEGERFTVSIEHEETGTRNTGLAHYDGKQFVVYELRHADMKHTGTYKARFASYKDRERVTSLVFRYEVYEDFEQVGDKEELTMLQELFMETEEIGRVTQRQGEYAEDRGDYANAAGDYANTAGDSRMMNWIPYVKTIEERSQKYPNPNNGDTLYVIDENKVFRYDGIDALDWEDIAGWDTSVIQDIYKTKEDKVVVKKLTDDLRDEMRAITVGARNLLGGTEFEKEFRFKEASNGFEVSTDTSQKTVTINPSGSYISSSSYSLTLEKDITPESFASVSFYAKPSREGGIFKFKIGNSNWSEEIELGSNTNEYKKYKVSVSTNNLSSEKNTIHISHSVGITIQGNSLKVEEGNRPTTWTPSYNDVYQKIKDLDVKLTQKIEENSKTIKSNTGRIQSLETEMSTNVVKKSLFEQNLRENEEKFSRITQTANEFTSEVGKKVGAEEVKSLINQSAERIKIKASNIDFNGVVSFKNTSNKLDPNAFLSIDNGSLRTRGYYQRQWRDGKNRNRIQEVNITNGMVRISDPQGALIDYPEISGTNNPDGTPSSTWRSLYYTSDGISTYRDGSGKIANPQGKVISSGTIEFFSHAYSKNRGVTVYSAGGAIGLQAAGGQIHLDAAATVFHRSRQSNVVIKPHENIRTGTNEFSFGVSADSSGRFVYGDEQRGLGAGLRFMKSKVPTIYGLDATGKASAAVTLNIGKVQADIITSRNGKYIAYFNGSGGGTLNTTSALTSGGIKSNGHNFYAGVDGEFCVTDKRGYNSGKKISYKPIKASKLNSVSSRKYKTNIEDLQVDTLELLKKTDIKQYNLKSDLEDNIKKTKYGVILEDVDEVLHEGDAIDVYTMTSLLWDAVKKQQSKIEELENAISK